MNSILKVGQPYIEKQRKSTINQNSGKQIQNKLHRRIKNPKTDFITPIAIKQSLQQNEISQRLKKLLQSSPYNKLVSQRSQQQLNYQDSFKSSQYQNCYTPNQQQSQQLFKPEVRTNSLNSTNSSSTKPRTWNRAKNLLQKHSFDFKNSKSFREKDKQTISQIQTLLEKTSIVLQQFKEELSKNDVEKKDLSRKIENFQQIKENK
ncbi:unnamed protein product [Paramecium primaurelia]|uniref:Uncharacterized protein n=1 Tax=Paramecium primaurelia TaxID=5886 RepID=A0A8S1K1C1_PARPR|nr:unnamed protein product [Paramecium primaurelia]